MLKTFHSLLLRVITYVHASLVKDIEDMANLILPKYTWHFYFKSDYHFISNAVISYKEYVFGYFEIKTKIREHLQP